MASKGWALVTGASSGIGEAIAFELASKGYPLILISRNESRLQNVSRLCTEKFHVPVHVWAEDLSVPLSWKIIQEKVRAENIFVEILVNNAGFTLKGPFVTSDEEKALKMVRLHVDALMGLTHAFLGDMLARKRGRILNVASVYSYASVPFQAVYAGTKAFMHSFSESLSNEVAGSGVTVTVVYPGVTRTEFRERAGIPEKSKSLLAMEATTVAHQAVKALLSGKARVVPGFLNKVFVIAARLMPQSWRAAAVRRINRARGLHH